MAWIKTVSLAEASGELLEQYERIRDPAGNVANILTVRSLNKKTTRFRRNEW